MFSPLFLDDARPRTFEAYEETLRHWKRLTGDPTLPFGAAVLATFKVELHKALAAATVNKHLRRDSRKVRTGRTGESGRARVGGSDAMDAAASRRETPAALGRR